MPYSDEGEDIYDSLDDVQDSTIDEQGAEFEDDPDSSQVVDPEVGVATGRSPSIDKAEAIAAGMSEGSRRTLASGAQPGRSFGQNDYMPGPGRPMEARSTSIGQYGGSPIFVPTGGIIPARIIGENLRAVRSERKALEEKARNINLDEGAVEPILPQYLPEWRNKYSEIKNSFIESATKSYGGDRNRAILELGNRNSIWGQAYWDEMNALGDLTKTGNARLTQALKITSEASRGEAVVDEGTLELARDYISGLESGKDIIKVAKDGKALESRIGVMQYLKAQGLDKILSGDGEITEAMLPLIKDGRIVQIIKKQDGNKGNMRKAVGDRLDQLYMGSMDRKEIDKMLDSLFPDSRKLTFRSHALSAPSGGGRGTGYGPKGTISPQYEVTDDVSGKAGALPGGSVTDAIRLNDVSDDNVKDLAPATLFDSGGQKQFVIPLRLVKEGGEWYVEGKKYATPKESLKRPASGGIPTPPSMDDRVSDLAEFYKLEDIKVPYKKNEGYFKNMNMWDDGKWADNFADKHRKKKEASPTKSAKDPLGIL